MALESGVARGNLGKHFKVARKGHIVSLAKPRLDQVIVVCEGWAFEYLPLTKGRQQILAFLSAGDMLFPGDILGQQGESSARALTDVQFGIFSMAAIKDRIVREPQLAIVISELLGERLREANQLLTAVAQKSAEERVAWFLLHFTSRLRKWSADESERYSFPFLQQHIADTVGLTAVHVSRTMATFRARGWLRLDAGFLQILNRRELEQICQFTSSR